MTTTAIRCERPGCGGTIDGGYCDTCGMAPAPASAAPSTSSAVGSASSGRTGSTGRTGSRRTRSGSIRSSRGHLGAGLVDVPPVPARDPASAVLKDPKVSESKRFCGVCDRPVGRGRDGQPGLVEGFCANCGNPFSFAPRLAPGELVAGQYEVLGCLAHGGLGWIYLAMDHNLGNRLALLKLDPIQQQQLSAEVLRAALAGVVAKGPVQGSQLLGCDFSERALRFGLERSYRTQAQLAPDRSRRIELVDQANDIRPRTWS
jgi:hypothetical protein